jgi:predicted DNA-binding transcriptional regulator YafY
VGGFCAGRVDEINCFYSKNPKKFPMNRLDRISAILIMLQTKKWITADEISKRFGVCKRTIYRDLKTLELAGIPLGAESGKGYFIVDGFKLPPVMFTPNEAGSLLLAGKLIEKMTDQSVGSGFMSALDKIKAILPDKEKEFLEKLDAGIEVFYNPVLTNEFTPNNILFDIQKALAGKNVISIDYHSLSKDELVQNRDIEPIVLCFYSMHWHLLAYCRLRSEYRDFRVDRITAVKPKNEIYQKRDIQNANQYFSTLRNEADIIEVKIRVDNNVVASVSTAKYYYGFISEMNFTDYTEMTFISSDLNYTASWLLTIPGLTEIVCPLELKEIFINLIKKLKNQFL